MFNLKKLRMKTHILLLIVSMLSMSCKGQNKDLKKTEPNNAKKEIINVPKGDWKVDKEFDENGNLIRYDSIYSWSSNQTSNDLKTLDRGSLMQYFKSRFYTDFSRFENEGFEDVFSRDSLFNRHFFNDDFFGTSFGKDFMDIDQLRQEMTERQRKFLEKYKSEFIKPEDEN